MLTFKQQGKLRLFEVQVKAIFKTKVSKKVNHDYMGSVWHKKRKATIMFEDHIDTKEGKKKGKQLMIRLHMVPFTSK